MNWLQRSDLEHLLAADVPPCVSIYLPMGGPATEAQQGPIRLKNLLRLAEEQLVANGLRAGDARKLLAPARRQVDDRPFWQHRDGGLALFLSPDRNRHFHLPLPFAELAVVSDRFHIKPLLPLLDAGEFHILALSQNAVRFLRAMRYGVETVDVPDLPVSLAEALPYDDPEKQLQFHTGTPTGGGERPAIFYGHDSDEAKDRLRRYFRLIERALQAYLRGTQAPLVVAGVEYLLPLYREVNTYPHLLADGVTGNPEGLAAADLHRRAWDLVEPYLQRARDDAAARYAELAGTGRASADLRQIVAAASHGRVETLFVARERQQWGRFDPVTGAVQVNAAAQPGDEDLLDRSAAETFRHGGTVYLSPPDAIPGGNLAAALFRY